MSDRLPTGVADAARLLSLDAYDILDTPPERGFDDIVLLARTLCSAPVALVSLVASDRQWFKARSGFAPCETDLNSSVCAHVLSRTDLLVIPDLTCDPRTRDNALVTGEPRIRFYAGAPLRTPEGQTLGALCVIDVVPRPRGLSEEEAVALRALAEQVMTQLELRRTLGERDRVLAGQAATVVQHEAVISTQAAVSAATSLGTALTAVAEGVLRAVPHAEGSAVEVREGEELVYRAGAGTLERHVGLRLPLNGSLSGACLLADEAILCPDVLLDDRVRREVITPLGMRSAVYVPVSRAGTTIGVLKLQSGQVDAFTDRDVEVARLLAGTIAGGLSQAGEIEAHRRAHLSEGRYKAVFESAVDYAIIVLDLAGIVTDWNEGAARILGWEPGSMCGKPADTFFTPEDREAGIPGKEMHSALTEGRGIDERWHLRESGERFWASGEMMALRDETGAAIGFVKMLRDRTEQRQAAQALQAQTDLLQTITDHLGQAVFQMDTEGTVTFANPAAEAMFGWPAEEIVGRNLHETLHHSYPDGGRFPPEQCSFVHALRHGRTIRDREDTFFRRDGSQVRVQATNAPVLADGRVASAVLTVSDITERKAAERRLARSEARWRGLFEGMREGFFLGELIRDALGRAVDYRFVDINPAFAAQSGLPADSTGQTIRSVVPDIEQALIDTYAGVVETGEPTLFEIAVPSLARTFEVRAQRDQGEQFSCMFLDVTDRKQDEVRRAAMTELGDQLRDLTDKTEIARTAAEIMGRTLGLSHAGYGAVDPEQETVTIAEEWSALGSPSIAGLHRFRDYGSYIEDLKAGREVVIADTVDDPRTAPDAAALATIDVVAVLNLPVMERGRFVGLFYALYPTAHAWTSEEVAFVRSVADRTRAALARVEAEEQQHLLNHELSHRMKNLLAMVQSIATQTMRGATDVETAREVLSGRLIALSKSHDLLLGGATESAGIAPVIRAALQVHQDGLARFRLNGPDVDVGPTQALALSLMLHELATNAAKYGALSNEAGHVDVLWEVVPNTGGPLLRLSWSEVDGPPVMPPTRKGFGSRFIERGLATQVGGQLALTYAPAGVTCVLTAPLAAFQVGR